MKFISVLAAAVLGATGLALAGPETQPANYPPEYAAVLYEGAASKIVVASLSAQDFQAPPYPPESADWRTEEAEAFNATAGVRSLAHQARGFEDTQWPEDPGYLNPCRDVAHNLGDAALYLDYQGKHAQAVELVRDIFHLSDLLEEKRPSNKFLVRVLVGVGIRAIAADRLEQIVSGVPMTRDAGNDHDLQASAARQLIVQLLATRKSEDLLSDVLGGPPGSAAWMVQGTNLTQTCIETFSRIKAECTFAAILLACHLYHLDRGHWPMSPKDLVPDYLPVAPPDPWSDGKQTFGYIVIKGGLPDGSDRPLIYCRCNSPDGMFYRLDRPEYAYYNDDGSNDPSVESKHGGQFRDVARWSPPVAYTGPTTQPLP